MAFVDIHIHVSLSFAQRAEIDRLFGFNNCWSPQCRCSLERFHEAVIKNDEDDTTGGGAYTENAEGIASSVKRNEVTSDETTNASS